MAILRPRLGVAEPLGPKVRLSGSPYPYPTGLFPWAFSLYGLGSIMIVDNVTVNRPEFGYKVTGFMPRQILPVYCPRVVLLMYGNARFFLKSKFRLSVFIIL
jgi:hypothetical protein